MEKQPNVGHDEPQAKPTYQLVDLIAECETSGFTPNAAWLDAPATGKEHGSVPPKTVK